MSIVRGGVCVEHKDACVVLVVTVFSVYVVVRSGRVCEMGGVSG